MQCVRPGQAQQAAQKEKEEAARKAESQVFRSWLICNWSGSLSIWTVLLFGYLGTMLAKGWNKKAAHAEDGTAKDVSVSHSLGYYALLFATGLMAIANRLRNVGMCRSAFFLFGVLQAAITLHIGVSPDIPIPRMLEIESELGLEFISNLVVTAQLVLVDFEPLHRFLFLGMHTVCLVPFYMRVISYSALAASLRAVAVYTFVYLTFAIIKQQLDNCFVQHQKRQAVAQKACGGRGGPLSARTSCAHPQRPLLWPIHQGSLIVGRGVPVGLSQQQGSPGASGGRQDAVLGGGGALWRGSGGSRKQQSGGGGDEQEHGTGAQGASAYAYSALSRDCLVHRTQVFLKVYGSSGPEALQPDACAQMKEVLAVRLPSMHMANLAVRKGSLILALDLLEPVPSRQRSQAAQQHQTLPTTSKGCRSMSQHQELRHQHEREPLLCEELQAAAFEWCKMSGLSSLLVTGNVLTLQVNNHLRSCFWDAALGSWTSELSTEVPNQSAYDIALSSPALFLPHAPSSLQRRQQQRQQQLGANLQPHQQLHIDVTFQARMSLPAGCTLTGWDYSCATSSHLSTQQQQQQQQQYREQQQQQQQGEQRSTQGSDPPLELQLLARADGSYLPVSILNGGPQPTQAPSEHELQAQLSLPLSLVQQGGCCPLVLELWCARDACSLLHPSSSADSNGKGSASTMEGNMAAYHHHYHHRRNDPHQSALCEAGGSRTLSSSAMAQDMQASSWTPDSSKHSSPLGEYEQEAAKRAMLSDWLNAAPPPPTPHNYSHVVASASLLLLPSSMVQEVAELEAWAAGLSDPSQPPPSPTLVQSFLLDLSYWMQYANSWATGVGCEGNGASSSSAISDLMGRTDSYGDDTQAHVQVGPAGAGERQLLTAPQAGTVEAVAPAGAPGAAAPCCPQQHFQRPNDHTLHTGRAGAGLAMAQHAPSAPVQMPPPAQPHSTTASTAGATCQPQHACAAGNSAVSVPRAAERGECGGAVVEAMADVGWMLLHEATRTGLANVAGLVVLHLMRPPFGKPFAWVVCGGEEDKQELLNVEEAASATSSSKLPDTGDAVGRVSQSAMIGGPLPGAAAEGGEGGGNAEPPTWMRTSNNNNGGLPTCFFSPFVTDKTAAHSSPSASPHTPAAAAAAPTPITAPHSNPPHGAPATEASRMRAHSSPLALLHTHPRPAVHQQQLLHAALLSGQPHMVAAVLSWGHAQPDWVWQFDQEDAKGVSPRSLAQSLPQREELVPLLRCPDAPPSSHPPPPHPPQASHRARGASRHDTHQLGQNQDQIPQTQDQSGITGSGQAPSEAAPGRAAPLNLSHRGWFQGAGATAERGQASSSTQEPNSAPRGWFQDAAAAAYSACARPNLSRSGCMRRGEQLQGSSEISVPEEEQPGPMPGPQAPGQHSNVENGSTVLGGSGVGTYTGPVASALPPRLARSPRLGRSPARDQHGQQGLSPADCDSWYARCFSLPERPPPDPNASWYARSSSLPVGDLQGAATTMGNMAASLAQFARRSGGILFGQLDSSHGSGGTESSHMNSVSSATASSITPSSTTRPSVLSQAPSSRWDHPSPLGNVARTSISSASNHHQLPYPCPPNSPHSSHGRGTTTHPATASASPSFWWGPLRSLVSYLRGQDPNVSKDCGNAHGSSGAQGSIVAMEVAQQQPVSSPATAAGYSHVLAAAHGPGSAANKRVAGVAAGFSSSSAVSRLGLRAPSAVWETHGPQEVFGGDGGGGARVSRSLGGVASSPWVVALYVVVIGLALVVWLCVAWQGLRGSDLATGSGSGSGMISGVGLAHSREPVCESSGGDGCASVMSSVDGDPAEEYHAGGVHARGSAPADAQLGQEGAGRWQGEGEGSCSQLQQQQQQQQQETEHLLELPQLSLWEQICVLLECCIPLILSQTTLGMTPGARKAGMAVSRASYLHLALRAASTSALQHVLWIAYADVFVTLFIARLSKQVQAPRALTQLVMQTAVLVLLFLALGLAPGQALLSSFLLGSGVVPAATLLMRKLAGC